MAKNKTKVMTDDELLGEEKDEAGWKDTEDDEPTEFDLPEDPQDDLHPEDEDPPEVPPPDDLETDDIVKDDDVDEEPDDGADDEEDELENQESHSVKVQKRIKREQRLKREAEERADKADDRAHKADLSAFEARKVTLDLMQKGNERDINDAKVKLKTAKEDDDSDAEVEAMTEISSLQIKGRELTKATESNKEPPKRVAKTSGTAAGQRWVDRNRWFGNEAQFKNEIGFSRVIDGELGAEPAWKDRIGTAEYFAELDTRIHDRIPALRVRIKKAYGGKTVSRIAPVTRGTVIKVKKGKGVISLTKEQRQNAAEFGIKGKDLEEYARQVHKRELEEAKGGQ